MGRSVFKRLMLVLTAAAFVLATAVPSAMSAMQMPAGAAMAGGMAKPCSDCPTKAPASNDIAKMICGALTCTGVTIGLPARQAPYLPAFGKLVYAPKPIVKAVGASPAPDPFPPRPTVLG